MVVGKTMKIYLRLLIKELHHAKWKTFIVFLNYRNGCMQDYEDVLKRAPSCEMSVRWSADGSAQPLNESHIAGLLVWMKKKKKPKKRDENEEKKKTIRKEKEKKKKSPLDPHYFWIVLRKTFWVDSFVKFSSFLATCRNWILGIWRKCWYGNLPEVIKC